jgi:hypothetical protein
MYVCFGVRSRAPLRDRSRRNRLLFSLACSGPTFAGYGADGDEDDARRKPAHPRPSVLGADGEAQRTSACPHNNVRNTPEQPLRFGPTERSRRESEEWAESRCRCGMGWPSLSSSRSLMAGLRVRSAFGSAKGSSVALVNAADRSLDLAPSGEGYRQQTGAPRSLPENCVENERPVCRCM